MPEAKANAGLRAFEVLAERARSPLALLDAGGRLVWCNPAWLEARGRTFAADRGEGWTRGGLVFEDEKRVQQERTSAFARMSAYAVAYAWAAPERAEDVLEEGSPIHADDGTLEGWSVTLTLSSPIVEAARVESGGGEPRQLSATLLATLSDLGFGIVVTDASRFRFVNDAFCRLTGYTPAELASQHPLALVENDERTSFKDWIRLRRSPVQVETSDLTLVRKDGVRIKTEATVMPIEAGPHEESPRWVSILRDVTALRLADAELEAARREVAQAEKLSVLGSLVSGVAHEIRTPLAYLDNHVSLIEARVSRALQHDPVPREMIADLPGHAAAAHEGVDRINRLVKDLRRFIKMESQIREPYRLDRVVEDALRLFETAHRLHVPIEATLEETPPLPLDPAQIQQVVINLLDNAADAMRTSDRGIRVTTRAAPGGCELLVEDRGIGIPPDVVARIYDPFFSTKPDGTGLGLAIVRRIVESHGGHMECTSQLGVGTTFRVFLPRLKR